MKPATATAISRSLLGADARWIELALTGMAVGALPGYNENAEPWLYLFVPAWLFYVFLRGYGLVRNPRAPNWAFVLGLGYAARRRMVDAFVVRKLIELATILAISVIAFFIARHLIVGSAIGATLTQAGVLAGELVLLGLPVWAAFRFGLVRPLHHDAAVVPSAAPGSAQRLARRSARYLAIARLVSSPLRNGAAVALRRQSLYLLRTSRFTALAVPPAAWCLSVTGAVLLADIAPPVMAFLVLLAPVVVCTVLSEPLSLSAAAFEECGYYWMPRSRIFAANIVLSSAIVLPYLATFAAYAVLCRQEPVLLLAIRTLTVLFGLATVILVFSLRWLRPGWTGGSLSAVFFGLLFVSSAVAAGWYGPPIALAAVAWIGYLTYRSIAA